MGDIFIALSVTKLSLEEKTWKDTWRLARGHTTDIHLSCSPVWTDNLSFSISSSSLQPNSTATTAPLLPPTTASPAPKLTAPPPKQDAIHYSAHTHATVAHFKLDSATTVSPSPLVSSSAAMSSSVVPTAQETKTPRLILDKVKCPHCKLACHKRNLATHIQRKHNKKSKDITVSDHLKSVSVDATNGIAAVQKASHGFSVPVHVQKKTWGHVHKVQCWKNTGSII